MSPSEFAEKLEELVDLARDCARARFPLYEPGAGVDDEYELTALVDELVEAYEAALGV